MSSDAGWYAELTGEIPSASEIPGPGHSLKFFGDWDEVGLAHELLEKRRVGNRLELTSFQRTRCRKVPAGEPEAVVDMRPHWNCGFALTSMLAEDGKERLVAIQPAAGLGMQHRLRIDRAHVMPNRVNAILEGAVLLTEGNDAVTEHPVAFHDHQFAVSRGFYQRGLINDFILCAFAQSVRPATGASIEVAHAGWMKELGIRRDPCKNTITVDVSELAMWMPHEAIGMAAYAFRGCIESVKVMPGESYWASGHLIRDQRLLGVRVWRLRTLIGREPDFTLDIFASDACGGNPGWFTAGSWIEGVATMSGYCWW